MGGAANMNPLGYNYPAGAEHDPSAPWNQPDDCEACEGTGQVADADGPDECQVCNGTGRQKTRAELRQEWEEDKADMERDER